MTIKLFIQAIMKFVLGVVLVGAFIFVPAGTILWFNGWLLMGILFVPMFFCRNCNDVKKSQIVGKAA